MPRKYNPRVLIDGLRCGCCRRPVRLNCVTGYCSRKECRHWASANDGAYRTNELARYRRNALITALRNRRRQELTKGL
jgi:hypothetical protein